VDRLFGDLAVDDAKLRRRFDWRPPFTVDEGLALLVAGTGKQAQDGTSG
jgi:nucleoside-diphosphate-sugar epimerase